MWALWSRISIAISVHGGEGELFGANYDGQSRTLSLKLINPVDLCGRTALVTGGTGNLGAAMAMGLSQAGVKVAILSRSKSTGESIAVDIRQQGGEALVAVADVRNRGQLTEASQFLKAEWGELDILVNAAGGNIPAATLEPGASFFDIDPEAFEQAVNLNLMGTVLPSLVFAPLMLKNGRGSIIHISSMAAGRALTRTAGYGVAKAGIENLTRWMAVNLAQQFGSAIRVNAIAPGFFVSDQNRSLMVTADGSPTERGMAIIAHTPMGRFGDASDLVGTVCWLASDGSRFVTGVVIPVDGGFSAFAGV